MENVKLFTSFGASIAIAASIVAGSSVAAIFALALASFNLGIMYAERRKK